MFLVYKTTEELMQFILITVNLLGDQITLPAFGITR